MPNQSSTPDLSLNLSPHFTKAEFACKCGCGFCDVDPALITGLESLRLNLNRPILINSGCRCAAHNAAQGGAKNSQHVQGKAADIKVSGLTARELYAFCVLVPQLRGFGVSDKGGFVHVDTRSVTSRWCYAEGKEAKWVDA
jgi:uncharacterized protein YcbK (DUF882 family)